MQSWLPSLWYVAVQTSGVPCNFFAGAGGDCGEAASSESAEEEGAGDGGGSCSDVGASTVAAVIDDDGAGAGAVAEVVTVAECVFLSVG